MRIRVQRAALLACGVALLACSGGEAPGASEAPAADAVRFDLLDYFPVALVAGGAELVDTSGSRAIHLPAGSAVTYHFALPWDARLRGTGVAHSGAVVRVTLTDAGGHSETLLEHDPAAGEHLALDADLSAHAARMARLAFTVEGGDVDWHTLALEGRKGEAPVARIARRRYNVLVVLFDSLRADHIAPYGAVDAHTPNLARFASEGVTFAQAHSSASWTRASVAAMFTSVVPRESGVLGFRDRLGPRLPYLPEILHEAGYRTLAFSRNAMISESFGFERGFDVLVPAYDLDENARQPSKPELRAAMAWAAFEKHVLHAKDHRPFFFYIHELDPHSPYDPPEPYRSLFDFGYQGHVQSTFKAMREIRHHPERFDAEDIRQLDARYRGEIAFMDSYLGVVLDLLAQAGLADDTLVVFVSDHGEEFFDHGNIGHGFRVYEEQLRVPFIMRLPGVLPAGLRLRVDANLVDLPRTVLDLLGIEAPPELRGRSLLPAIDGAGPLPPRPTFASAIAPAAESARLGRWKLIDTGRAASAKAVLYDLDADPGETRDLAADHPIVVATLDQMLRWNRHRGKLRPAEAGATSPELPPEVRENLHALGYLDDEAAP